MTEQILTVDVDWGSKSGSADATVGFCETFTLHITGMKTESLGEPMHSVRLVLLSQSVPDEDEVLWAKDTALFSVKDDTVVITGLKIDTQAVLDILNQQGGKARLYLAVTEMADGAPFADYGVSRLTTALGTFIEDENYNPPEGLDLPSYSEVKQSVDRAKNAAEAATKATAELDGVVDGFKGTLAQQDVKIADAGADAAEARATAEVAESIAKGAQYAKVFETKAEMEAWAAEEMAKEEAAREVKIGDNLYIKDTGVPDYWWSGEGDGYAQLETGAVKIEVDTALSTSSTNPVQNKVVTLELGKKAPSSHNHAVSDVNGLRAELDGKADKERINSVVTSLATKQDKLTAGANIAITDDNVISARVDGDIYLSSEISSNNVGDLDPTDMNSMARADNCNQYFQIGTLADWGFSGVAVKINKLIIFRRANNTPCAGDNLWCRILRWSENGWYVAYQASQYQVFGSYTNNGQPIVMAMAHVFGDEFIPTNERVIVCFTNNKDSAANSTPFQFGAKVVPSSVAMIASEQTSIPSSASFTPNISAKLAMAAEYEVQETLRETLDGKQDMLCAGEGISIVDNVISATGGGGVAFPLQIPKGECIEFGTTKFQTYESDDIRFDLNDGTFCIESGYLILGNSSNFRAGDFCMSGHYLGKALGNLIDGSVSQYIAFNTDGRNSSSACAYPNSIAIGPEAQTYCSENIVIGLGDRASHSTGQRLISMYTEDSPDQDSITDIAFCLRNPIIFSNGTCSNVFFGYDDNACSMAIGSYFTNSNGCMGSVIIPFSSLGGGGCSGGGGNCSAYGLIDGVNVDGCKNGAALAYCGNALLAIGYCANANCNYSIVVGHSSNAPFANSIVLGHDIYEYKQGSLAEYLYCKADIQTSEYGAVIFDTNSNKTDATRAFFSADGCGRTLIGGVVGYDSNTCLKTYGYVSIKDLIDVVNNGGVGGGSTSGSADYWTNADGKVLAFPWSAQADNYVAAIDGTQPINIAAVWSTGLDSFAMGTQGDWIDIGVGGGKHAYVSVRRSEFSETYYYKIPKDIDTALSSTSVNPVQNKVVKAALDEKVDMSTAMNLATRIVDLETKVAALEAKLGTAAASVVSGDDDLL